MDILLTILLVVVCSAIVIVLLTACISVPLLLVDWLIFRVWLGRKSNKYDSFYDLSVLWLTRSYKLPFKMYERGAKYGWLGVGLMLVSPAAMVTYGTAFCVQQLIFPFPLSEEEVPYKTHEDLVAITDLQDFPAFTYDHNVIDGMSGDVTIYYDFDQVLSFEYNKKLSALCQAPDNCLWRKSGDFQYVLNRSWDGKYIKSSLEGDQIELTIGQSGFTIKRKYNIMGRIEDFAEAKNLNKLTGVTFPEYKVVNYQGEGWHYYDVVYYLLLDKKPSKQFIRQLENSPKWTKQKDGTYHCRWDGDSPNRGSVTVDKDSRVIKAEYIGF